MCRGACDDRAGDTGRPDEAHDGSWDGGGAAAQPLPGLEGVERVFLACGNLPPQVAYETNLIDAAARAGVARLVKLSALGAGIGSPVDFWDWHARIEEHLGASGIPSVVCARATT